MQRTAKNAYAAWLLQFKFLFPKCNLFSPASAQLSRQPLMLNASTYSVLYLQMNLIKADTFILPILFSVKFAHTFFTFCILQFRKILHSTHCK